MEKSKYPKQPNVKADVYLINQACCDCGLVHKMGFSVNKEGIVTIAYERENRATAQLRRGEFPYLKNPLKNDKWKLVRRKGK